MRSRKKLIFLSIIAALAIAWCFAIYRFSAATSNNSNSLSTNLSKKVISEVLDITNEAGVTDSHPDDEKLAHAAQLVNAPLRKVAHASVYLVLAILVALVLNLLLSGKKFWLTFLATLLGCFLFALADEYHQTFVAGRTGQFLDVLIDTAGACVGLLIFSSYYLVWWVGKRK